MPTWIRVILTEAHTPRTPLSRYTFANGIFYLVFGLTIYVWPGISQLLGGAPFEAGEAGMARLLGMAIAFIGWFYCIGARTHSDSFGLATVVDRLLVPFFMVPLVVSGDVDLMFVLPLPILDPILAIGAWFIWARTTKTPG